MQRNPTLLVFREVFNLLKPDRIHEKRRVALRVYCELHGSVFGTVVACCVNSFAKTSLTQPTDAIFPFHRPWIGQAQDLTWFVP